MELVVTLPATGVVTTITPVAVDGLVLYNDHDTATVTISSNANVSPGNGIVLKPKGTLTWTQTGSPIYGVSNSALNIPILVTDSIGDMTSPLDIAIATATRLINSGVPNIGLTERIFAGTPTLTNKGRYRLDVPLKRYASVILYLQAQMIPAELTVFSVLDDVTVSKRVHQMSAMQITIIHPVIGEYFEFDQPVYVVAIGTNRASDYQVINPDVFGRFYSSGVTKGLNNLQATGTAQQGFIHKGGPVTIQSFIGTSSAVGIFSATLANTVMDLITPADMVPGNAAGTFYGATKTLNLPPGALMFSYNAEATASFNAILKVVAG